MDLREEVLAPAVGRVNRIHGAARLDFGLVLAEAEPERKKRGGTEDDVIDNAAEEIAIQDVWRRGLRDQRAEPDIRRARGRHDAFKRQRVPLRNRDINAEERRGAGETRRRAAGPIRHARHGDALEIEFRRAEIVQLLPSSARVRPREERFDAAEALVAQPRARDESLYAARELVASGSGFNRRERPERAAERRGVWLAEPGPALESF